MPEVKPMNNHFTTLITVCTLKVFMNIQIPVIPKTLALPKRKKHLNCEICMLS